MSEVLKKLWELLDEVDEFYARVDSPHFRIDGALERLRPEINERTYEHLERLIGEIEHQLSAAKITAS